MPAPLERAREARSAARACAPRRAGRRLHVGRLDERVGDGGAEGGLDLGLELLAQPRLDVGAQLGERVELGRGLRELVVERRAAPSP